MERDKKKVLNAVPANKSFPMVAREGFFNANSITSAPLNIAPAKDASKILVDVIQEACIYNSVIPKVCLLYTSKCISVLLTLIHYHNKTFLSTKKANE